MRGCCPLAYSALKEEKNENTKGKEEKDEGGKIKGGGKGGGRA